MTDTPTPRRIRGTHVRRAILVACIANVAMLAWAPSGAAPIEGLRATFDAERPDDALARLAAIAP